MPIEVIGNAVICFFELLSSPSNTLQQIRKQKYNRMVAADRSKIGPAHRLLEQPWTLNASSGLSLETRYKGPLGRGWIIENKMFRPIMTDNKAGPSDLLRTVHFDYKGPCGKSCSCRKAGINCASTCKECHGITCTNSTVQESDVVRSWTYLLVLITRGGSRTAATSKMECFVIIVNGF